MSLTYSPSAAIDALVSGYPARIRAGKVLVVLQAYVDDSAFDEHDRRLFLAGYVLTAYNWKRFSDDWDRALHQAPSISSLHMVEAENLSGEFYGWSAPDRDKKVLSLAHVIFRHRPASIAVSISRAEHAAIFAPAVAHEFRHPYYLCYYTLIVQLAQWHQREGVTVPVDFIFDEQGSVGLEALMWYDEVKKLQAPEVQALLGGTPVFKNDTDIVALQAADMLAWHVRRVSHPRYQAERRPMNLLCPGGMLSVDIDKDFLLQKASQFNAIEGIEEARGKAGWKRRKHELRRRLALKLGEPLPHEYVFNSPRKRVPLRFRFKRFCGLLKPRRLLRIVRRWL